MVNLEKINGGPQTNTSQQILLPAIREENTSCESTVEVQSEPTSLSTSPVTEHFVYISRSPVDFKVPQLQPSELTNLCSGLSLAQTGGLPTDFLDCKTLFTPNEVKLESLAAALAERSALVMQSEKVTTSSSVMDVTTTAAEDAATKAMHSETGAVTLPESTVDEALVPPESDDVSLSEELPSVSSDGKIKLVFVKQPERQHRARYLTEGSRGAVKDQEGSGYPIVEVN